MGKKIKLDTLANDYKTHLEVAVNWRGGRNIGIVLAEEPLLPGVEIGNKLSVVVLEVDGGVGNAVLELSALLNIDHVIHRIRKGNFSTHFHDDRDIHRALVGQRTVRSALSVTGKLTLIDAKLGVLVQWRAEIGSRTRVACIANVTVAEATIEVGDHAVGIAPVSEGGGKLHLSRRCGNWGHSSRDAGLGVAVPLRVEANEGGAAEVVEDGIATGVGAGALPLPRGLEEQLAVAAVLEDNVGKIIRVNVIWGAEGIAKVLEPVGLPRIDIVKVDDLDTFELSIGLVVEFLLGLLVRGGLAAGDFVPPFAVDDQDADLLISCGTIVVRAAFVVARPGGLVAAAAAEVLEALLGDVRGAYEGIVAVAELAAAGKLDGAVDIDLCCKVGNKWECKRSMSVSYIISMGKTYMSRSVLFTKLTSKVQPPGGLGSRLPSSPSRNFFQYSASSISRRRMSSSSCGVMMAALASPSTALAVAATATGASAEPAAGERSDRFRAGVSADTMPMAAAERSRYLNAVLNLILVCLVLTIVDSSVFRFLNHNILCARYFLSQVARYVPRLLSELW